MSYLSEIENANSRIYTSDLLKNYYNLLYATRYDGSYLNKSKEKESIKKAYFHSFEFKDRTITLCVAYTDDKNPVTLNSKIKIGYSVCMPQDTFDKELSKKISKGRALKTPLDTIIHYRESYNKSLAFLGGIAKTAEHLIKDGKYVIKGIK